MSEQSDLFHKMAERIIYNEDAPFGGAAVIALPNLPGYSDKHISLLVLDPSNNPAQFLSTLQTRIQLMIRELDDAKNLQQMGWQR